VRDGLVLGGEELAVVHQRLGPHRDIIIKRARGSETENAQATAEKSLRCLLTSALAVR
jgi:hypothetical protein